MTANYVLLEKIVVGAAGAANVTFSGIPQTGYTDLILKFSARGNAGAISRSVGLQFNGSSAGYSNKFLQGDGASVTSGLGSSIYLGECTAATATSNTFANQEVYIPNYASSNFKTLSVDSAPETNATTQYLTLVSNTWSNTAAITSINLSIATGNFVQGSAFYLYGVARLGERPVIAPSATGGDIIMTDGSYWYHAFRSSGTFTPVTDLTCDYLVVAGGGGGNAYGGGGGAGGLRSTVTATGGGGSLESRLSLAANTNYTVTIGAGGSPGSVSPPNSSNGSNSVFSTITSIGGGGVLQSTGQTGGSGGGSVFGLPAGSGTANQGFAGGPSQEVALYPGGGGGGAGAAGQEGTYGNPSGTRGGNGGAGVAISAFASATGTGVSNYYAGGGGGGAWYAQPGGTGGAGGGGAGGYNATVAGVANTGSGGGGSGSASGSGGALSDGGAGGSGIVIVRYAV